MYKDKQQLIEKLMNKYSALNEWEVLKLVESLLSELSTEELSDRIKGEGIK